MMITKANDYISPWAARRLMGQVMADYGRSRDQWLEVGGFRGLRILDFGHIL